MCLIGRIVFQFFLHYNSYSLGDLYVFTGVFCMVRSILANIVECHSLQISVAIFLIYHE